MKRLLHFLTACVLTAATGMMLAQPVQAGTDLTVDCFVAGGGCSITPANTPLFDETSILPGDSFEQVVTATNTGGQDGIFAVESLNIVNTDLGTGVQLSDAITIQIREGSSTGPILVGPVTLTEFIDPDPEFYLLSGVTAGSTQTYYFQAEFDVNSGNEFQGLASIFDLRLGFELVPSNNDGGSGSDGGGSDGGGSSDGGSGSASPPVCTADAPSSAPNVSITSVGANTVTLSWSQVSPVTHYGLIFTRNADGEQYGAPNIGNVTSYTVTNLSGGGANYTFQVFGVNDCAPGPFSNGAETGGIPGPVIESRPVGGDGQVLGETDTEPDASPEPSPESSPSPAGEVAGAATCVTWKLYIPWILLIAQAGLILANEYYFRQKKGMTKHYVTIGITLASIFIFYLVRECDCYDGNFWLVFLCRWYWLVSLLLSVFLRGFSYAFIEEVEDKTPPQPPEGTTAATEASDRKVVVTGDVTKADQAKADSKSSDSDSKPDPKAEKKATKKTDTAKS